MYVGARVVIRRPAGCGDGDDLFLHIPSPSLSFSSQTFSLTLIHTVILTLTLIITPSSERFVHNNVRPSQLLLYRNRSKEHWPFVGDSVAIYYKVARREGRKPTRRLSYGVVVAYSEQDPPLWQVKVTKITGTVIGPKP